MLDKTLVFCFLRENFYPKLKTEIETEHQISIKLLKNILRNSIKKRKTMNTSR